MFNIQVPEQFVLGVRPASSAEPREDTQLNLYVFQCMIIYDLLFLSIIVFVLSIIWFCFLCHGLLDKVMVVTKSQWLQKQKLTLQHPPRYMYLHLLNNESLQLGTLYLKNLCTCKFHVYDYIVISSHGAVPPTQCRTFRYFGHFT